MSLGGAGDGRAAGVPCFSADRKSMHCRSQREDDVDLRFCYRRLQILLRREGGVINRNNKQQLYSEDNLAVQRNAGATGVVPSAHRYRIPCWRYPIINGVWTSPMISWLRDTSSRCSTSSSMQPQNAYARCWTLGS